VAVDGIEATVVVAGGLLDCRRERRRWGPDASVATGALMIHPGPTMKKGHGELRRRVNGPEIEHSAASRPIRQGPVPATVSDVPERSDGGE